MNSLNRLDHPCFDLAVKPILSSENEVFLVLKKDIHADQLLVPNLQNLKSYTSNINKPLVDTADETKGTQNYSR